MKESVSFFLPVRKGSQRVFQKSTREFAGIKGGLLELKLKQLIQSELLSEIVLSTNDEEAIEIASKVDSGDKVIQIIERPNELCLDTTPLTKLIEYVPTIVNSKHILWGHVTTPFVDHNDYDQIITSYLENIRKGFDSLVTVMPFQNFLLNSQGEIFNLEEKSSKWPRTQDLPKLFEVNHAVFLASKDIYTQNSDRLGKRPFLFEMDKIKSLDIDWEEDFKMAEALYEKSKGI